MLSNGNIFCITVHLCRDPLETGGLPSQSESNMDLWCFFIVSLNKLLNKDLINQLFGMPWCHLVIWQHHNVLQGTHKTHPITYPIVYPWQQYAGIFCEFSVWWMLYLMHCIAVFDIVLYLTMINWCLPICSVLHIFQKITSLFTMGLHSYTIHCWISLLYSYCMVVLLHKNFHVAWLALSVLQLIYFLYWCNGRYSVIPL